MSKLVHEYSPVMQKCRQLQGLRLYDLPTMGLIGPAPDYIM